jgi:FkbM family methyltransferase
MSRTPRVIAQPQLTRLLVQRGAFLDDPVFVVDVGASGGIESYWSEFHGQLIAVGFDPLIAEVDRLNALAPRGVRYVAAWVTCASPGTPEDSPTTQFFARTSAVRAAELASLDFQREYYNTGAVIEHAADRIVLDNYFDRKDRLNIDFVKVDTDGHDYEVLLGCDEILGSGRVLGLAVEAQFHGPVSRNANLFSNIDALLRDKGFGLFDLEVYRYSRAALPAQFVYDMPANTTTGQISWGEAFYFRDLGDPDYERTWAFEPTIEDVLKLACLFEIFGMPDCSAELIVKYGQRVGSERERTELLDILASEQAGVETTHSDLLREFAADAVTRFGRTVRGSDDLAPEPSGRVSRLRQRLRARGN